MTSKTNYFDSCLPSRLTDEEMINYFKLYQLGDKDAYRILIEHNLRLVVFITRKYENTNVEIDDLISIGNIGLIKAVRTFNLSKNVAFATYASRCIENEILMYLRKYKNLFLEETSLDAKVLINSDDEKRSLYEVFLAEACIEDKAYEELETRNELRDAIRILDEIEKIIINELFPLDGSKVTQKFVAEKIGISRSYVSRLKRRACKKMASYINAQYNSVYQSEEKINTKIYSSK